MILQEILDKIELVSPKNSYLYFITRVLKPKTQKNAKLLDKYSFKVYQIDVNDEIRDHLYNLTKKEITSLINKKLEIEEYNVIGDDIEQIYTYQITNKTMSFYDVVNNQLKNTIPKLINLENVIENEELWAYSVGFYQSQSDWIYTFRKILSSKVAVEEKDGNKRNVFTKSIRTMFNTVSNKLELLKGETINLDKQVDCIYYNEVFYISKKTQFEQIVGLEDEFKEQALDVVKKLEDTKFIEGLEVVSKQIESNPSIHKKLVRLSKIGNYNNLDKAQIAKMESVAKQFGNKVKFKDGKLLIEDEKDIDDALKMLADYYKEGKVSGKSYGTFAGKELNSN